MGAGVYAGGEWGVIFFNICWGLENKNPLGHEGGGGHIFHQVLSGGRGVNVLWGHNVSSGSVVECRTPEREVRGSRPTAAVLCP